MKHNPGVKILRDAGRPYGHQGVCSCGWRGIERLASEGLPFSSFRKAEADKSEHFKTTKDAERKT